ncbi:hypothetical protein AAVH_40140, partial [Aphelenchoides avenae]
KPGQAPRKGRNHRHSCMVPPRIRHPRGSLSKQSQHCGRNAGASRQQLAYAVGRWKHANAVRLLSDRPHLASVPTSLDDHVQRRLHPHHMVRDSHHEALPQHRLNNARKHPRHAFGDSSRATGL